MENWQAFGITLLNTHCVIKLGIGKNGPNILRYEWPSERKGKTWHYHINQCDVEFSCTFYI